jgi:hypothetical protein
MGRWADGMSEHDAGGGANGRASENGSLPETPHELPVDRGKVDDLVDRVRAGEKVDLLEGFLGVVDWRVAFGAATGEPLTTAELARLVGYYREKFAEVGPLYLAELLSTEFMTEQRARGDVVFSDRLLALGRNDPDLWTEIRLFFRRKEFVTALLAMAHAGANDGG